LTERAPRRAPTALWSPVLDGAAAAGRRAAQVGAGLAVRRPDRWRRDGQTGCARRAGAPGRLGRRARWPGLTPPPPTR